MILSASIPRVTIDVDRVNEEAWNEALELFDDASIYQTWAYGAVRWGDAQLSHIVVREEGRIIAAAQVRIVLFPLISRGVAYIRWGPMWRLKSGPAQVSKLKRIADAIEHEYLDKRGLVIRIVPHVYEGDTFAGDAEALWREQELVPCASLHHYFTSRISLTPSLETLRKNLHQRWRNHLKSAEKSGLQMTEEASTAFYDRFLVMYDEMMARKRFETTVDVREFSRIQSQLPARARMQVFIAQKEGKDLNALVVSAMGDTGIYLFAATSNAGLEERGAYLLQWRAIEWLKGIGAQWYDLCGINPQKNPGVYQFKHGMGGQDVHQLHPRERSKSWLSSFCVGVGERVQSKLKGLRGSRPN